MKAARVALLVTFGGAFGIAQQAPPDAALAARLAQADMLYREREARLALEQAMATWAEVLATHPDTYEAAWKLARAAYYDGTHAPEPQRAAALERGIEAARRAVSLQPHRPDGHFWLALVYGGYAQEKGIFKGLSLRKPIREELETVLKIDPGYERGGAYRVLGRYYYKLPGWLGGSKEKSEQYLRLALPHDPANTATHLFLGDTLVALGRKADARKEYQAVLDAPLSADWVPEDRDNRAAAGRALKKLGR